ncbi:MAG TPA: nucleotidyltransferase family protein [Burkholderiaceae bacterium]|nr:nucleotidyltransferase family protein [Burkholderiaceae bacterium]
MRAMILAAGRGERMRPLTDTVPKPLLRAGGKPLIVWHVEHLVGAGVTELVINHAWLGHRIVDTLGDGTRFGACIRYSAEDPALETAGGIAHAMPLLGSEPFLVVNGDIWCDWNPAAADRISRELGSAHAWLLLADNPPHHPDGDFHLDVDGHVSEPSSGADSLTFSGIGVYRPELFERIDPNQPAPLSPLLRQAMQEGRIKGARHAGFWMDIGTPQRLAALDQRLAGQDTRATTHPPAR